MTKIAIISGFLGAGKTTLIKKMIAEAFQGQKLVLIENEFGEIGIDGGFLKDSGIQITEMNSGCICCSLVGDFSNSLQDVIKTYHPDRILIEPSGVGKLSDVVSAVLRVGEKEEIEIDSLITVADAAKCKIYMKNFGEFYNDQIQNAGTVILSRTQNVKQERLEAVVEMIREKSRDEARIVTTPWDQLTGEQLLKAIEKKDNLEKELMEELRHDEHGEEHHSHHHEHGEECHDHHHEHGEECHDHHHEHGEEHHGHHHEHGESCHDHHHADEVFTSWGRETPKRYAKEELESILSELSNGDGYGTILRVKGMLPALDGGWMYFDLVPEEYEIREGSPEYTGRICVIGSALKEERLAELFDL